MYYELYIDSLFLVNFVMNLYLLLLVNRRLFCTATRIRLILGAGVGAGLYLLPFLWNGAAVVKLLTGLIAGTIGMICTAFQIRSVRGFVQILEKLLIYSFLMGGILLFLIKWFPIFRNYMTGVMGIMGMGALVFLVLFYKQKQIGKQEAVCFVTLICKEGRIKVAALIDSGNSLTEPVSGKPVSVIEKSTLMALWGKEPELYRVIPYHSIGKKHGILHGYLLPELQIEVNGVVKKCMDVYIAVCDEMISGGEDAGNCINGEQEVAEGNCIKMILNPVLLDI